MSYTDYLKRRAINTPKVIDQQMKFPDASSHTWRTKLASTSVNRRTDHIVNNVQDPSRAPMLFQPKNISFQGSGFGGKVPDASLFTLSRSAAALGQDSFSTGKIVTNTINTSGGCLTQPPASQVVSEFGNSDGSLSGLNMGYSRQMYVVQGPTSPAPIAVVDQARVCTSQFRPLTKSHFVDTIPELKTRKIGSALQPSTTQTAGGIQVVQNEINCQTTNTSGGVKSGALDSNGVGLVSSKPVYRALHSEPAHNPQKALFVTGVLGPQTGGGDFPGSRAPKVGGVTVQPKGTITHRGWGGRPRPSRYPEQRVPPTGAPAQLKINEPNHYKF
jgi:hypothetical protein